MALVRLFRQDHRMKVHKAGVAELAGLVLVGLLVAGCGSSSSGGTIGVAATPPSSPQQIEAVKANLQNLATAEESYLTDYYDPAAKTGYTADSAGLASEGFQREPGTEHDTLLAGVDGDMGYCLIGSPSAGDVWVLYDSASGGGQDTTYPTQAEAEAACTDTTITDYQEIAGTTATPDDSTPPPPVTGPVADVQANLRNLAVSEEVYLTDYNRYTADGAKLAQEGFMRGAGTDGQPILAGVDGDRGYCLIGSTGDGWIVYDSQRGGISAVTYASQSEAEAACSDPEITDFQPID